MPAVVQHLSGLVDSLRRRLGRRDAGRARHARCRANRVSFAGPGKTSAELTQAIAAGVTIEMESATEAERVDDDRRASRQSVRASRCASTRTSRSRAPACGWAAARSSSASTPRRSQLCSTELAGKDLEFLGFHIFAGSQNLNAEILCEAQRKTVELALRLADASPVPIRYLNLGGGFGIPYFERDQPLDLGAIGENLHGAARRRDPAAACPRPESSSSSAATSSASAAST